VTVTDTFEIAEHDSLSQGDFAVTFLQDGAAQTPDYTITNDGGGSYTLAFDPSATGRWQVDVSYSTYKFSEVYDVGPIEPENDIPIEHQTHRKGEERETIWSDRIMVRDGESHRVWLPRSAGKGYSVMVTREENRGMEVSVKKAFTFFDIRCKMFDTLAGNKSSAVVEYTVCMWDELSKQLDRANTELRRRVKV
jgi:hypothetical protein